MVHTVRVQVPFPAPKKQVGFSLPAFLLREMDSANPYPLLSGTGAFAQAKALSSKARCVQLSRFHGFSLPAFLLRETDSVNPYPLLAVRASLRKQRRYRAKRDMFNCLVAYPCKKNFPFVIFHLSIDKWRYSYYNVSVKSPKIL